MSISSRSFISNMTIDYKPRSSVNGALLWLFVKTALYVFVAVLSANNIMGVLTGCNLPHISVCEQFVPTVQKNYLSIQKDHLNDPLLIHKTKILDLE